LSLIVGTRLLFDNSPNGVSCYLVKWQIRRKKDYGEIERATRDDLSARYIAHDIS